MARRYTSDTLQIKTFLAITSIQKSPLRIRFVWQTQTLQLKFELIAQALLTLTILNDTPSYNETLNMFFGITNAYNRVYGFSKIFIVYLPQWKLLVMITVNVINRSPLAYFKGPIY